MNISTGWPVSTGGVIYPTPIVSSPNANATQSISGGLNLGAFPMTAGAGTFTSITDSGALSAGAVTATSLQGIQFINTSAVGTTTGGIQECINALPAGGGKCILPPNSTANITATINVNKANVEVSGAGLTSILSVNTGLDVFNVTQTGFILKGVTVDYAINTTRSGKAFILAGADVGLIRDVQINGSTTSPTNGIFFSENGTFGAWSMFNLFLTEGGPPTWDSFISIVNGSASVTAASYFVYNLIGGGKYLTAGVLLDGALDTIQFTGGALDGLTGTSGPTIWVRNTVAGFIDPRWVHFNGFSCEAQGQTCVKVDNVRDFQYFGYCASATTGFAIGAGSVESNIHDTIFANIAQSAITVANGAIYTNIHHNQFDDTANSANNTFDTISIAANAGSFGISNNTWRNVNATNHPRNGINIAAGTGANFEVVGNVMAATFGTSAISNSATGSSQDVVFNSSATNSAIIAPAGGASSPGFRWSTDSSTGLFQLSAGNYVFTSSSTPSILYGASVQRFKSAALLGWAAGDPTVGISTTNISQSASGVLQVGTGETANAGGSLKAKLIQTGSTVLTVATLPTCNAAAEGTIAAISDATAPTYNGTLTGGGAVHIPVYCNGTAWTAH